MNGSMNSFHTTNNGSADNGRGPRPTSSTADRDGYIERLLTHYVWEALDLDMLDSAEFTMEKLLALDPENGSYKHLMALILYRQGRYKAAANIANTSSNHTGCVYIYSRCCLKLKMYGKGIEALEKTKHNWASVAKNYTDNATNERRVIPDQAALNALLGKLYQLQGDKVDALKAYGSSVRANPFLWEPVEALCKLGIKLRVSNAFRVEHLNDALMSSSSAGSGGVNTTGNDNANLNNGNISNGLSNPANTSINDPFTTPVGNGNQGTSSIPANPFKFGQQFLKNSMLNKANEETMSAPVTSKQPAANAPATTSDSSYSTPSDTRTSRPNGLPLAPQKRSSRNVTAGALANSNPEAKTGLPFPRRSARMAQTAQPSTINTTVTTNQKRNLMTPLSRAGPQGSTTASSTSITSNAASTSNLSTTSVVPGAHHATRALAQPQVASTTVAAALKRSRLKPDRESLAKRDAQLYIISLYRQITSAFILCSRYECRQAIALFDQLPEQQKNTPWVLAKLGRCYFEMVDYKEAEKVFIKLRKVDRCRIQDMEYYSTLLWHLRKEVELSLLAHELMEIERNSPQAWCTLGNSFSLKRETSQAQKCFKRAINIDPDSPYAYTLLAHEQVATEAYESAQDSFRLAIKADNRHYNAWYGLGMVFMRLDNFDLAELHFSKAAMINPSNVVLICCIGMVLEKKGRFAEALEQYKRACEIQSNSALARYKKARVLIQLQLYNAALVEFEHLQKLAPDEASVHFLLGQLYKLLDNRDLAIKHFTIALNLDPKGSGLIKDAIEGLNVFNTS
ncbi:anaphase promoting complex subunit CDC27 [Sugiyamaella lignohabitans]|uniref:Anaphase promoting complex subunit CDC27 n=1 Tax=Sugiyamaella lignohabitans TaxID=796027 RepID=A0A161HHT3_9ASCO|nr:anaphase promoting complex subunit CDC27 [Sugiyamaella lignohabitans]ANB11807.1 anaphase promoting complex subunit CDC27 [Sugiyamaella lignohabitans]